MADSTEQQPGDGGHWCQWCGTYSAEQHDDGSHPESTGSVTPTVGVPLPLPAINVGELHCNAGAIVFVAMEGLATLVAHSADSVIPALERISRCFEVIVTTHNGEWEGELGSYQISFSAYADDLAGAASRAVRATIELARDLDEGLQELAARGIVIGPVFAIHLSQHATLTAGTRWRPLPEVLEIGQELLSAGDHYSIVASDAVIAAVGHLVKAVPLDSALRRGRGAVFQLGEWQGARPERPSWSAEGFSVACDEDIQHLVKRWREIKEGEGTFFLTIIGPDGSGKRRLIEEFLSQIPDGRGLRIALSSSCETTRLVPLFAISEVIFRLIDVDPQDDDDEVRRRMRHACRRACRALTLRDVEREASQMAALIGRLFGLDLVSADSANVTQLGAKALRKHGFFALTRLLQGLTIESPRVLVFENLHEADAATLEFLNYFGSNSRGQGRMFILNTARPALIEVRKTWGRGWWRHETMTYESLDRDELIEVGQGVASRAGSVPEWLLENFADIADGDPFWMEQLTWLAASRAAQGLIPHSQPGASSESFDMLGDDEIFDEEEIVFDESPDDAQEQVWPNDLHSTLTERITTLNAEHRKALEVGALIGLTFPEAWVQQLMEGDEPAHVSQLLRDLEAQGLLRRRLREDVYRFRGEALWRAARSLIDDGAHTELNRALARILERDTHGDRARGAYARVALHHHLGGETDRAIRYYALGARRAQRVNALDEAEACYQEAMILLKDDAAAEQSRASLALLLSRGQLRLEAGDMARAIDDLEASAELARVLDDNHRECEALFLLAAAYDRGGLLDRADESLAAAAARIMEDDDPRQQVLHLRRAGWLRFATGDKEAARTFLARAVDVGRRSGVDLRALARSLDDLAIFDWIEHSELEAIEGFSDLISNLRGAGPSVEGLD